MQVTRVLSTVVYYILFFKIINQRVFYFRYYVIKYSTLLINTYIQHTIQNDIQEYFTIGI